MRFIALAAVMAAISVPSWAQGIDFNSGNAPAAMPATTYNTEDRDGNDSQIDFNRTPYDGVEATSYTHPGRHRHRGHHGWSASRPLVYHNTVKKTVYVGTSAENLKAAIEAAGLANDGDIAQIWEVLQNLRWLVGLESWQRQQADVGLDKRVTTLEATKPVPGPQGPIGPAGTAVFQPVVAPATANNTVAPENGANSDGIIALGLVVLVVVVGLLAVRRTFGF